MNLTLQAHVHEGHPELSFMRLAGADVEEPKRKSAGRRRRHVLIESELDISIDTDAVRDRFGRRRVAVDDVLDAVVLTIAARHRAVETALRIGGSERDSRGLEIAM